MSRLMAGLRASGDAALRGAEHDIARTGLDRGGLGAPLPDGLGAGAHGAAPDAEAGVGGRVPGAALVLPAGPAATDPRPGGGGHLDDRGGGGREGGGRGDGAPAARPHGLRPAALCGDRPGARAAAPGGVAPRPIAPGAPWRSLTLSPWRGLPLILPSDGSRGEVGGPVISTFPVWQTSSRAGGGSARRPGGPADAAAGTSG